MASVEQDRFGNMPNKGIKAPVKNNTGSNITLNGEQLINGVNAEVGQRWLVDSQTNAAENGIYDVALGDWSRSSDWDHANDVGNGVIMLNETSGDFHKASFTGEFSLDVTEVTFTIGVNNNAGGAPVLLETWNVNGEANKLLVTDDFALYRELLVVAEGLTVAIDGASIEVQFVDSSNTVYVGSNYFYARKSTVTDSTGSSVTSVQIGSGVGNAVNEGIAFELKSLGFNGVSNPPAAVFDSAGARNTGINYYYMRGIGGITDIAVLATQFKGFNLLPGAGNFGTSGVVRFYGIPY